MEPNQAEKISNLLSSNDEQLCNLGVTIFLAITRDYSDYVKVRREIKKEELSGFTAGALYKIFNSLDSSTMPHKGKRTKKSLAMVKLSSKQRRKKYKHNYKKRVWNIIQG